MRPLAVKQELHALIDRLPEGEVVAARRYLQYLCDLSEDPVVRALREAPFDDEPLGPEEAAESESAWKDYLEGRDPGEALEKVRRSA